MKRYHLCTAANFVRFSFVLAFLISGSGTGWVAGSSVLPESGSISIELLAPDYQIQLESDGTASIQADGFQKASTPGSPALPHRLVQLALPPGVEMSSVTLEISILEEETLPGVYDLPQVPPDLSDNATSASVTGDLVNQLPADSAYVRLLSTGQMRKWRFATLDHSPIAFHPAAGQLSVASRIQATVHFKTDPSSADTALLSDDLMDGLAEQKFDNYDQAEAWYPQVESPAAPQVVYDYVIITTNAIEAGSTKLDDFILHKQDRGFSVLTITESEYGGLAGQSPNGTAEKIRKWLQDNYASFGIKYVLLIGNPDPDDPSSASDAVGDVPMKMCWPRLAAKDDKEAPTDYFFADLTGNWNKDGDLNFGEWSYDQGTGGVDFAPEVYVGRIPVYSAAYATLDAVLQKIMDYENETSPLSWRKNALLPMSFGADSYDGAPLAEQMMDDYLDGAGFTSWTQYQQGGGACNLDSTYASSQELRGGTVVRDRWAANDYGLVLWWGHGSATSASIGYADKYNVCWDGTLLNTSQTASLDDDHPAFVYQNSCTNGYPENTGNLQYSLLKQGAVASVSASRVSWFNTNVDYGEFDGSTTNSGIGYEYAKRLVAGETAAEALYNAKSSMTPESATRLMNFYDFNLYGDPAAYLLPPASPSAFNKTSPANMAADQPTSLTISWQSTSPVTRYEYCYDTSNDNSCSSWINNGLDTSAILSGLSNDTTYYWQVRAMNGYATPAYANANTWWHFTSQTTSQSTTSFLPIVIRSAPPSGILNGDFEQGSGVGWQQYSSSGYALIRSTASLAVPPHSGSWAAWLGGVKDEYSELYQQVTIPSTNPMLSFWYWIGSEDYCGFWDSVDVLLGSTILLQYDLCEDNSTGGWVQQNLNLNTFAGQTLVLKFAAQTDSTINSNFFLDDVSFGGSSALGAGLFAQPAQDLRLKPGY